MRRMFLPLIVVAAACQRPAPTLTEQQQAAIADTIRQLADTYMQDIRAVDFDRVMAAYGPELVWAENSVLAANRDSLVTAWRAILATWREVTRAAWGGTHVKVLGPDAAVISAAFDWAGVDTVGAAMGTRGAWTAVYVRTDAGWKIAHAHESWVPVPTPM